MGPRKQAKVSRWQPLPDNVSTLQVASVYGFDDHTVKPDDLSKEELENCLKFIEQSNRTLEVENTVIERYLHRMDPTILLRMDQVLEAAAMAMQKAEKTHLGIGTSSLSITGNKDDAESISSIKSGNTAKSFSQSVLSGTRFTALMIADKGPKVQPAHRIEIVNREIEEMRNGLEEFRKRAKHTNYILRCRNEELSSRLQEIIDSRDYFEDKLLVEGADPLTGKLPGEKFIRYLEMKLQSEESEIDKMRMKTSSTRNQLKRVEQQLAQKAELGEILHAVDFEQLKIENKECQEHLEEKILHLIDIKKVHGRCGTMLNFNLKKLQEQVARLSDLHKRIAVKEKMINQLEKDLDKVNGEVNRANRSVVKIKKLMNTYAVPDVFDYILEKAEMLDLKKEIKVRSHCHEFLTFYESWKPSSRGYLEEASRGVTDVTFYHRLFNIKKLTRKYLDRFDMTELFQVCDRKLKLRDLTFASQATKLRAKMDPSLNLVKSKSSKRFAHI